MPKPKRNVDPSLEDAPQGVYIYVRVSTGRQVLGTGLETQERDCRAYAERLGWSILRVFREEGESAKTARRTELQEMLRVCRSVHPRPSFVLIHALDRFARNGIDHDALREELLELGIKLRCVLTPLGETPYDRYIERVLSGLPQLDNELRGERSLAGMKMRVEQGRWTFKAPIGYLNGRDDMGNKTLLLDPHRAEFVKEAFERYATGLYTKEQVREHVNGLCRARRCIRPSREKRQALPASDGRVRQSGYRLHFPARKRGYQRTNGETVLDPDWLDSRTRIGPDSRTSSGWNAKSEAGRGTDRTRSYEH